MDHIVLYEAKFLFQVDKYNVNIEYQGHSKQVDAGAVKRIPVLHTIFAKNLAYIWFIRLKMLIPVKLNTTNNKKT